MVQCVRYQILRSQQLWRSDTSARIWLFQLKIISESQAFHDEQHLDPRPAWLSLSSSGKYSSLIGQHKTLLILIGWNKTLLISDWLTLNILIFIFRIFPMECSAPRVTAVTGSESPLETMFWISLRSVTSSLGHSCQVNPGFWLVDTNYTNLWLVDPNLL